MCQAVLSPLFLLLRGGGTDGKLMQNYIVCNMYHTVLTYLHSLHTAYFKIVIRLQKKKSSEFENSFTIFKFNHVHLLSFSH